MSETAVRRSGGAGSFVWTVVGNAAPPLGALFVAPFLAQGLGVEGRGEVAAATAPFLLAVAAMTLGIPESLTFWIARNRQRSVRLVVFGLALLTVLGAAAAFITIATSGVVAAGSETVQSVIHVVAWGVPLGLILAGLRGAAFGAQLWKFIAIERIVGATARVFSVVVLFSVDQLSVPTAALCMCFGPLVGVLVYCFCLASIVEVKGQARVPPLSTSIFQDLVGYGSRAWIGAVAGILLMRLDQVLLNPLAGPFELGLYVVAVNIAEVPLVVISAVREVLFAKDAQQQDDRSLAFAARATFACGVVTAIVVAGSSFWWIEALFGPGFISAYPVVFVAALAVAMGASGSIAGSGLAARGRPGRRSAAILFACIVNVLLIFVLVPRFGALGAAYATLVGNIVSSNLNIVFLRSVSDLGIRDFYRLTISDLLRLLQSVRGLRSRSSSKKLD